MEPALTVLIVLLACVASLVVWLVNTGHIEEPDSYVLDRTGVRVEEDGMLTYIEVWKSTQGDHVVAKERRL